MADILERGDLFCFYRPRVHGADDFEVVRGAEDVASAFLVLRSHERRHFRRVLLGRKRLPARRERGWALVERVTSSAAAMRAELDLDVYETKTRGLRVSPPARAAGEGAYALVGHDDHTHLVYVLALPHTSGDVQDALGLRREASFIVAVRNPEAPRPPGMRAGRGRRTRLPAPLQERFGKRRHAAAAPDLLDQEGVELTIIGAGDDVPAELGVELEPSEELELRAKIFAELRTFAPLTEGRWG